MIVTVVVILFCSFLEPAKDQSISFKGTQQSHDHLRPEQ